MGGGGWWINPLQTLPQGLVFTIDFDPDPDPELDNFNPPEYHLQVFKKKTLLKGAFSF